jgi:hypothetical protein
MNNDNKPIKCVFVSSEFAHQFPNFNSIFRQGVTDDSVIFDCISADNTGNYLEVVAINQELADHPACNSSIWIPTRFVLAVLLRSEDKKQMGFCRSPQDDKDQ